MSASFTNGFTDEQKQLLSAQLKEMTEVDELASKRDELSNELETFVLRGKNDLDGILAPYLSDKIKGEEPE